MDFRSVQAMQGYGLAKTSQTSSATTLEAGLADFAQTLARGEVASKAAMTGSADPHALVQALAETQLAVETAVTVRDKVVEAYQEILRMPV